MTLPWLLLLWRSDERHRVEQARQHLVATGLGAAAPQSEVGSECWSQKLAEYDALIARYLSHG